MIYIEANCIIDDFTNDNAEILIAYLNELGFYGFSETNNGILAYITEIDFNEQEFNKTLEKCNHIFTINYTVKKILKENWNKKWESNYPTVLVDGECLIKASFHQSSHDAKYEITIEPKMSFGTGHHDTTYLMVQEILRSSLTGKKVLDMGCGTGVLAILASMMGAAEVIAIDTDEWAYKNTIENIGVNNINNVIAKHGGFELLKDQRFDVQLANINRNTLSENFHFLVETLNINGKLIISGFYESDLNTLMLKAEENNLTFVSSRGDEWVNAVFIKNVEELL